MSDEKQPETGAIEETEFTARDAMAWKDLLETLVPPKDSDIEDVMGNVYRVRSNLPAAVEREVVEVLRGIGDVVQEGGEGLSVMIDDASTSEGKVAALIDALIRLCADERVLVILSDAFKVAHPRAAREAVERGRQDADVLQYLDEGAEVRPCDVFSAADLVEGVVPFAVRAVAKAGRTLGRLLPSTK